LLLGRVDARRFGASRDALCEALAARGIPCTPFYPHPLYANPVYQGSGCRVEPCPVAEECVRDAFWLPHRVLLSDAEGMAELASVIRSVRRNPIHV
jgi:dTDP-4-amino-4,6-dideoxygalactose transaminase